MANINRVCNTMSSKLKHVATMASFTRPEVSAILNLANEMKKNPQDFRHVMQYRTLLMLFEKPSLRTRLSFETGTTQLGGHAIFYSVADSPLGDKENVHDTIKCASRFVDIVMARVKSRHMVNELIEHATVPVINALDDWGHPCQILADFQTIQEHLHTKDLSGITMSYIGDLDNNVTYDLARGSIIMGMNFKIAGPPSPDFQFSIEALEECARLQDQYGGSLTVCDSAEDAVSGSDVIYADTFQSYHIPKDQQEARLKALMPYQVNSKMMELANRNAIFMHCLPASRDVEVSSEVIDGPQSVIFDQAENRMHAQKALMAYLL